MDKVYEAFLPEREFNKFSQHFLVDSDDLGEYVEISLENDKEYLRLYKI